MRILTGALSEYYHNEFVQAAEELGIELIFVNPEQINIVFGNPSKIYDNEGNEIKADGFFLRATNRHYREYALLVRALISQGCVMLDPIDRFTGNAPNKMLSSIKRATCGIGVQTLYFTREFVMNNPSLVPLPLFIKPVDSSQNRGLVRVESVRELLPYLSSDYIVQKEIRIKDEYRVLAYNHGEKMDVLGVTHKKTIGLRGKNEQRKFKISESTIEKLVNFLYSFDEIRTNTGLFGYDIAKLEDGSYVLIEANRSPMWERTERIRKVSVAKSILEILKNKINELDS